MANIIHRPDWFLPERSMTPEAAFRNRREFLRQLGFAGSGLLAATLVGCNKFDSTSSGVDGSSTMPRGTDLIARAKGYPALRNPEFNPGWRLTSETAAGDLLGDAAAGGIPIRVECESQGATPALVAGYGTTD